MNILKLFSMAFLIVVFVLTLLIPPLAVASAPQVNHRQQAQAQTAKQQPFFSPVKGQAPKAAVVKPNPLGIYQYGIPRADWLIWLDGLPYDNRLFVTRQRTKHGWRIMQ